MLPDLPRYRCHKEVCALKIQEVRTDPATLGAMLIFADPHPPISLSQETRMRFKPQAGGYWIWGEDGYPSWSPAAAFESGYSRIN